MAPGDASPSTQITRPSENCTRYSSCQSASDCPDARMSFMHTVAVFRMERRERRSGIFNNILRCNPVYSLDPRAGIREVRAGVGTKTVLVKQTGKVAGQLFSVAAHSVERLVDPLESGDVLYRRWGQLEGCPGEQRGPAPPAIEPPCQLGGGHAIRWRGRGGRRYECCHSRDGSWGHRGSNGPAVGPV